MTQTLPQVAPEQVAPGQVAPPVVPRPRPPVTPRDPMLAVPSVADVVEELDARRPRRVWPVAVLDLVLAVAAALVTARTTDLPLGVALAAAAPWPLLLLAAGHYRQGALGDARGTRAWAAARTGVRATVVVLAGAPLLAAADPMALAQLSAACGAASAAHALARRPQRPRLVLAGRPRDVREAMEELASTGRHEVVAACLTRPSKVSLDGVAAYVGLDGSAEVVERHRADALVLLPGARLSSTEVRRLHWALGVVGAELCVGTGLLDVTPGRARVLATGGLNLVHVAPAPLRGPCRWVKEAVERTCAVLGLLVLLPVLVVLGVLVRLDSSGPAIYSQVRVGRDGRLFTMYKLRSMSSAAHDERMQLVACNESDGVLFKIRQDPRVTRTGRWLRRTSLDELPQLWNVVRGEMSLVGPRPALPDEVERYGVDPRRRLVVKPGITGLWQVSGRSDLSWAESVRLDVRYVDNWSLGLDLAILVRTVRAVVSHRGAY